MREHLRGLATMVALAFCTKPRVATALFIMNPVAGAVGSLTPLWFKLVADAVQRREVERALVLVACVVATDLFIATFLNVAFHMQRRLQEAVDLEIDRRIIDTCSRIPTIEHHERPDYLDRVELLRTSRGQLSSVLSAFTTTTVFVMQVATTLSLLAVVHPLLMLLPLFGIPSVMVAGSAQRRIDTADEETAEANRQALHLFDLATTSGPGKELRVFGHGERLIDRHEQLWTSVHHRRTRAQVGAATRQGLGWLVFSCGFVAAIIVVARGVAGGSSSAGDMLLVITVAAQVNYLLAGVSGTISWLVSSVRVIGRFLWLLDYAAAVQAKQTPPGDQVAPPNRLDEGITLQNVAFRYPETDRDVLRGVDLHLPAGATVAIVGQNGAGKSTLVKLLCRYYEPTDGTILVDGVDVRRIDVEEWRKRMAGAFQDFVRFELLLRESVGVGHVPELEDEAAVRSAIERASATDVVDAVRDGLDAQLGGGVADGVDLSGGQWQKLAIARAMMRRAPLLLILDEPTAALDPETEHALFGQYAAAAKQASNTTGAITVIVSHRFSTARMADLVVVIDDNRVVEVGSHTELSEQGGLYATLYELQARSYR